MAYRDSMLKSARDLSVRGTLTFSDASAFALTAAHIRSFSVEEGAGGGMLLGAAASASLRLSLANPAGEWLYGGRCLQSRTLIGAWVKLELGVKAGGAYAYSDLGTFKISGAESEEGGTSMAITACDAMLARLNAAFSDTQTYPRTVNQILSFIAGEAAANGAVWSDCPLLCNGSVVIAEKPDWGDACTVRQALGYAAAVGGCFARVKRDGTFTLAPVHNCAAPLALGTAHYTLLRRREDAFSLNRIVLIPRGATRDTVNTEAAAVPSIAISPANTIELEDNPLCRAGAAALASIASGLLSALAGMTLQGITAVWRGDPTLLIGDRISLTDRRGDTVVTAVTRQTLEFDGGFSARIECGIETGAVNLPSALTKNGTVKAAAFAQGTVGSGMISENAKTEIADTAKANLKLGGVNLAKGTYLFDTMYWTYYIPAGGGWGLGLYGTSANTMLLTAYSLESGYATVYQSCPVQPSAPYVLSVRFIQTNSADYAANAYVRAVEYDSGGSEIAAHYIPVTAVNPNADRFIAFTTLAACVSVNVQAVAAAGYYIYWEKPKLEYGNKNTAWTEALGECSNPGVFINEKGIQVKTGGDFIVDAGGSIALYSGGNDATINSEPILHGGAGSGRVWVSTAQPAVMEDGDLWVRPDTSVSKSGNWTKAALASKLWATVSDHALTGIALGAGSGTYKYTVRIPIFHSDSNGNSYSVSVYLAAESGGTAVNMGTQAFSASGWFEAAATSSAWLGNASSVFCRIVLAADGSKLYLAVNSGKALSAVCEDIVSGAVSGIYPCSVYRKIVI